MKRLLLALPLIVLAACSTLTPEEEAAVRDALAETAIEFIAEAKESGIDPVQLPAHQIRIIGIACRAADTFLPILESYLAARNADDPEFRPIDFRGYVGAACAVALAVVSEKEEDPPSEVAPAVSPVPVPAPESEPA